MLEIVKHTFKKLQSSHGNILKVCLTIFQHYAWNGLTFPFLK